MSIITEFFKRKKNKIYSLKVSAPFHCSLMKPAAEIMKEKINNTKFNNPSFEIINNVQQNQKETQIYKKLLIDQIFSTVNGVKV